MNEKAVADLARNAELLGSEKIYLCNVFLNASPQLSDKL